MVESWISTSSNAASFGLRRLPGAALQLGETVGHTEVEELYQLGSEPVVEARVAVERLGGPLVVDMAELVEGALEVDPGLEGDGPEEGHRVDLPVATDEPALLSEAREDFRRGKARGGCPAGGSAEGRLDGLERIAGT